MLNSKNRRLFFLLIMVSFHRFLVIGGVHEGLVSVLADKALEHIMQCTSTVAFVVVLGQAGYFAVAQRSIIAEVLRFTSDDLIVTLSSMFVDMMMIIIIIVVVVVVLCSVIEQMLNDRSASTCTSNGGAA